MASTIDELTVNFEEDGVQVVQELDKVVLSRGAWTTVLYKYRQWEAAKEDYGPLKFTIRRYKKIRDEYRQQAKFNITSADQAQKIVDALGRWLGETETEA
ncbi:MAG: hypothetical protein ACYDA8_11705 [Deferrisomatales bacterium]